MASASIRQYRGISGATVAGGVGVIIDTNGHLGTVVSSERFKDNVQPWWERGTLLMRIEAPGVEPVFPEKDQAINYAQTRAWFRSGEIRILDSSGNVERIIPFNDTKRKL